MPVCFPRPVLVAAALGLLALPAAAKDATCQITRAGDKAEGPCRFDLRKGGSFTVRMNEGMATGRAASVSLGLSGGKARVGSTNPDGTTLDWGRAVRDKADPACWVGDEFRLCVRAVDEAGDEPSAGAPAEQASAGTGTAQGIAIGEPTPGGSMQAAGADSFVGRCHMDACTWIQQTNLREIGQGSDAVPGRLVEVTERIASREYRGGTYPDDIPADLQWEAPRQAQYFCSMDRPAIMYDGKWTVLPLPQVFGATESATNAFIHACFPDRAQDDVYKAAESLGFKAGGTDIGTEYADFEALTAK